MKPVFLIGLAVLSVGAAYAWSRSARLRLRLLDRLETDLHDVKELDSVAQRKAIALTRGDYRRDLHAVMIYLLLATASLIVGLTRLAVNRSCIRITRYSCIIYPDLQPQRRT